MYVLDVATAEGEEAEPVVARLRDRLTAEGPVAVVRREPALDRPSGTTIRLGSDAWRARGAEARDLDAVLDDLAREHDYALTVGFRDASLPRLAVGDAAVDDPLVRAANAADVDPDVVARELAETDPHESLASLVERAERSPDETYAGALATFTGRVRAKEDPEDAPTEALTFEKYEGVAEERLAAIRADLESREGVHEVLFHHRTGRVEAGEHVVHVVVLAGHRREAFDTVEDGIDRLKDEVPFFKKEVTVDEEFWVHDRES